MVLRDINNLIIGAMLAIAYTTGDDVEPAR